MNHLQQDNQLKKLIQKRLFDDDIHPILWRSCVVDVDSDGSKFDTRIKGALRVRILGLHDHIEVKDQNKVLPIALPMFFQSGFNVNTPEIGNEVFCQFESLEPIGQVYWVTIVPVESPSKICRG
jgi:hypothetical protein